jgi:hypothetical protein
VVSYTELTPDLSLNQIGHLDLPEISSECARMRDQLEAKDREVESAVAAELDPVEDDDPIVERLQSLVAISVVVQKLGFRLEQLRKGKSVELREFLTEEVCRLEAEPDLPETPQSRKMTEVGDMLADFLESQKGAKP